MTTESLQPAPHRRIALYSHDTMGIGHMRRNLLVARALAGAARPATVLLIAGAREASVFALPPGVDCVTLPSLGKQADGLYQSRQLHLSLRELTKLRSLTIGAALDAFDPDVLIVDKVPRGAANELDLSLEMLRARGKARLVLGLREVLDDPWAVRQEWRDAGTESVIRTYYDAVWVYGDPRVYDPLKEYGLSADVGAKTRYTGYLDRRPDPAAACADASPGDPLAGLGLPPGPLALCVVGGGQDGAELAEAFAEAEFPREMNAVLVAGPFMPPEVRQRLVQRTAGRRFRVMDFVTEPELLLSRAARVVAMGGYNTVSEILCFEKPALIVPRVTPRREQWIRAERLRGLGLLDVLHPSQLCPRALSTWLHEEVRPASSVRSRIDFNGLTRLPELLEEVLSAVPRPVLREAGRRFVHPQREERQLVAD